MKKQLLLIAAVALAGSSQAQVKIGLNPSTVDPSAVLELEHPNKAFYLNRVSLQSTTDVTTVPNPKAGMVVYNTNAAITATPVNPAATGGTGVYYFNGTSWVPSGAASGTGLNWLLLGNSGTVDGVNFLGTTDDVPLNFRVNNLKAGRIEPNISTGNVSFGYQSQLLVNPVPNGNGSFNTSVGNYTLQVNTTGNHNSAFGYDALGANTTGDSNAAFGFGALQVNTTGNNNTATGAYSLNHNTVGAYSTAVGYQSLHMNVTDSGLTSVGAYALYNNLGGKLNVAMGLGSMFSNLTGSFNTANGTSTMRFNFTGSENTAVGFGAGYHNNNPLLGGGNNGNRNTFIGFAADSANIVGNNITALGYRAGLTNRGSFNTFLGSNTNVIGLTPMTYAAAIGAGATVCSSNAMTLGATDAGSTTTTSVNVGINVCDPTQRIDFRNGHIRNRQDNLPVVGSPLPSGNGVTAASVAAGASDVRGRINTVGYNNANGLTNIRVDFAYQATNPPIVTITPANESASTTSWFVTSDNAGFNLYFRNEYGGNNASGPPAAFNYMIIE